MGWAKNPPPEWRNDPDLWLGPVPDWLSRAAGRSVALVTDRINAVLAACEAERLEMPHVVHVLDASTGLESVFGPFDHPLAAAVFADRFVSDLADLAQTALVTTVIPLERGE